MRHCDEQSEEAIMTPKSTFETAIHNMKIEEKKPSNKTLWRKKIETDYTKHRDQPGLPNEIFKEKGDKKAGYTLLIVLTGILMVLLIAWFLF